MLLANTTFIDIEIPLTDDDIALEPTERVIYTLVINDASSGVQLANPEVTNINIRDDDGE